MKKYKPFIICALASIFLFYEFVLQISPSAMTHELMAAFKMNAFVLGTAAGFYYYAYTPMQLVAGMLFDKYGARITLTMACLLCASGALIFGLATSVFHIALGRFLAGGGSAFAFVGVLFLGSMWFDVKYFALIASLTELMGCMGAVGGEAPVAYAVHHVGWRPTVIGFAIFGFVLSLSLWLIIRNKKNAKSELIQPSIKKPIILKELNFIKIMRDRQSWAVGLHAFFVFAPISSFAALWGVPYLKTLYGISGTHAASLCSLIWIGMAAGSLAIGTISTKFCNRNYSLLFCAALGVISSSLVVYGGLPQSFMIIALFCYGIASSGQALSFAVVRDNARPNSVGAAMGFNNMLIVISGALGQPLVGYLLHLVWNGEIKNNIHYYSLANYHFALSILPISYAIGFLICLFGIKETRCIARH